MNKYVWVFEYEYINMSAVDLVHKHECVDISKWI